MRFEGGALDLIDQRYLPHSVEWVRCESIEQVASAIEQMVVRGAPAIGCAAAFGIAIDAKLALLSNFSKSDYLLRFDEASGRLARTRPTAVNLFFALEEMRCEFNQYSPAAPMRTVADGLAQRAQKLFEADLETCKLIGEHGAGIFKQSSRLLKCITHCNAGSLATAGYGTALGVIRSLHKRRMIEHVYADETRPFMQGSRLTMFELMQEGIPSTVICDSAAAFLMQREKIDFVVVGADRIAANGDTANKIGTYSLAIAAARHGVPFYVAAPLSTFDPDAMNGGDIPIELRSEAEVTHHMQSQVAPQDAKAWNPSFDVTPADLIAGIVTERGILRAPYTEAISAIRKA
jgi:methylthioribose-1-phosphate isomerase